MSDQLQARGWHVIPSYDYSGEDGCKAPRMQGVDSWFTLPDLDIARNGKRFWVEVKAKGKARQIGQGAHSDTNTVCTNICISITLKFNVSQEIPSGCALLSFNPGRFLFKG